MNQKYSHTKHLDKLIQESLSIRWDDEKFNIFNSEKEIILGKNYRL